MIITIATRITIALIIMMVINVLPINITSRWNTWCVIRSVVIIMVADSCPARHSDGYVIPITLAMAAAGTGPNQVNASFAAPHVHVTTSTKIITADLVTIGAPRF
ncbi:hypothetical protein K227x_30280 [Rubripirellula lacrimiformis]|uniref:Uncharacterized protein n=1 Tax=Rubripirellula lacrimiformis TaxID=1930273 RepID=A0A517NBW7_9BACT|nr:hypothetical protein K227x_30280 [Rubripirellula lacrimiformis]